MSVYTKLSICLQTFLTWKLKLGFVVTFVVATFVAAVASCVVVVAGFQVQLFLTPFLLFLIHNLAHNELSSNTAFLNRYFS